MLIKFETIDRKTFASIAACFTPTARMIARLGDVDLTRGAGVLDSSTKCLWTKNGHRVEIWYKDGSYGAACSRTPDPNAPPSRQ